MDILSTKNDELSTQRYFECPGWQAELMEGMSFATQNKVSLLLPS